MHAENASLIVKLCLGICSLLLAQTLFAFADIEGIQSYQRNMHLFPEHKQNLADDIDRYNNADNIWDALRREFALPHYEDNPRVQARVEWFLEHQSYLQHSISRAAPYLYYIFQQTKKRHLPAELVLLPIIESAYNPFAQNASSGAAGIWQMMRGTASGYGIRQTWWYDGRRDVVASTKAALNHLAYLQSFFEGNWLLAIAAYDTGEGNVLSAIRKNINRGENTDFWALPVASETQDYVPRLLALATILSHPEQYALYLPPIPNAPYLAQIDIGQQITLKNAASLAGLSLKQLKQLNPGYSRAATDPHGPFKMILPIENVIKFTENLALYLPANMSDHYPPSVDENFIAMAKRYSTPPQPSHKAMRTHFAKSTVYPPPDRSHINIRQPLFAALSKHPYTLQPGDTLYMTRTGDNLPKIAKRFHLSVALLASVNRVTQTMRFRGGQKLIIPTHHAQKYEITPGDTIYMVRKGDTIDKIAYKFHTTASAVRLINLLASNHLQEGDRLVIPTHV